MINRLMATNLKKKQRLRNNEYYDTQEIFDNLYHKSKSNNNYKFYKLMDLITSEQNIELAYRNIKNNKGSKTSGTNSKAIEDLAIRKNWDLTGYIKCRLQNYHPHSVRRVEILKENGKIRPLGIPTIEDRLIQQCIFQILEPICEAKFYKHSYGFRPNRSTHHAISRCYSLANQNKLHYVVDIDIKGFFDNVNHGKLLKQMWTLGIQDKQLLCIIGKMLKAPIENMSIQNKGIPQGGILSPLLSNIVLNELDDWVAGQWEHFETKYDYTFTRKKNGKIIKEQTSKYASLRRLSNMKEVFIVRYADDFKLFCRDYKTAKKMFISTKMWLKERLQLDISEEKSKIVNLKTNYSDFLGIKMKVHDKGSKKVVKSYINNKAKLKIQKNIKEQITKIQKHTTVANVNKYNAIVLGAHNYYKVATHCNKDFNEISYKLLQRTYNRTKDIRRKVGLKTQSYKKFYDGYNHTALYIQGIALFPVYGVTTKAPMNFSQDINNFTKEGRYKVHKRQQCVSTYIIKYIMENPITSESIKYNDNRISLYLGQNGICPISKEFLTIGNMECHHKISKIKGGTDEYSNLIFLKTEVHILVHATSIDIITKYMQILKLSTNTLRKLNKLRVLVGNFEI